MAYWLISKPCAAGMKFCRYIVCVNVANRNDVCVPRQMHDFMANLLATFDVDQNDDDNFISIVYN